jgi:hypothetical protein
MLSGYCGLNKFKIGEKKCREFRPRIYQLGYRSVMSHDFKRAEEPFRKSLEIDPNYLKFPSVSS